MSFGAKWSKIRIGIRYSINGTTTITAPEFVFGICCGLTNGYKSSNTDFVFGICVPGKSGTPRDLTYTAGPPAYYSSSDSIGFDVTYRTGNTTTKMHSIGATTNMASTANNPPACFAIDITPVGSVYTMPNWYDPGTVGHVQSGNTFKQMIAGMDSETGAPWDNMDIATLSSQNSVSDSHLCGCVTVYWSKSSPTLEVSDIQVVRFA